MVKSGCYEGDVFYRRVRGVKPEPEPEPEPEPGISVLSFLTGFTGLTGYLSPRMQNVECRT